MKLSIRLIGLMAAVLIAWSGDASAGTVIGNLPGTDNNLNALINVITPGAPGSTWSMGFTMGATPYTLSSALVRLVGVDSGETPRVELFSNSASNLPGSSVLTFTNPSSFTAATTTYTFAAPSSFTLQANTTYWLRVSEVSSSPSFFDWEGNSVTPTGLGATHFGAAAGLITFTPESFVMGYEIDGTAVAVPEPSSLVLAGVGVLAFLGVGVWKRRAR